MAIIKNAKNINIQVNNEYSSICKVSYEEAEEVIIDALNENLELSSQKKVVMQGFGNDSEKEENKKLEESKLLEIRVEKGTFIPLGIPDFEGKNENEKIKFQIIIKQGTFERLTFKIKSESADIYSEKITQSLKEGDVFPIEWDGFSKDKVCDTTWFVNNNLIAEITDGTNTSQIKVNGKCKVKWIDIKINTNSKKVEVSLRVNLKESKVEKNVVKNFNELVLLTQEGLSKYWGRNKIRKIGNSIKINGNEYEIFINSVNIEANSMPALNVYASTTNYGRSRNWWASRKLFYNDGESYAIFKEVSTKYPTLCNPITVSEGTNKDVESFVHTAAHEIGHEILQAFGGQNDYSYIHKGTSTLLTQKVKKESVLPNITDEIDLMKYYFDDYYVERKNNNFYDRNVASEKDVLGLLWCSKIVIL